MADVTQVPYPGHPRRCHATHAQNGSQCMNLAEEGSDVCAIHKRHDTLKTEEKSLNMYRIHKFNRRLAELKEATGARSLDEELAILRMLLEEIINRCDNTVELQLHSQKISDLVGDIRSTVLAADKLAARTGMLVGRSEAMMIAGRTVEIISQYVPEDVLSKIAEELQEAFLTPTEQTDSTRVGPT